MPQIGIGVLQDSYVISGVTWTKVTRVAQGVPASYVDQERGNFPVVQYNRSGGGGMHMSIHSGFAGSITNVHYTNGNFNNAKMHYNLEKGGGVPGFSVDWGQVGKAGKKGFSSAMPAMQAELVAFLVQTQIDPNAMNNIATKDQRFRTAENFASQPAQWGKGRHNKNGSVTYHIGG